MKKGLILFAAFFVFAACETPVNDEIMEEEQYEEELVGDDRDENNCIASAGETWSQLQEDCIKIFEVGEGLSPVVVEEGKATFNAFVLFNDDKSKLELYLPVGTGSYILDANGEGIYENDDFKYNAEEGVLYIDGEKTYVLTSDEEE